MAILTMLFRKMKKNHWLVISLLAGMVLCTALSSSIPIYKNASLHRMLMNEMDLYYENSMQYPGNLYAGVSYIFTKENVAKQDAFIANFDRYWEQNMLSKEEIFPLEYIEERQTIRFQIDPVDPTRVDPEIDRDIRLVMRTDLMDHVRLVDGRFPSSEPVDGVYEVLVTDNALIEFEMVLGNEFISNDEDISVPIKVVPVGVIVELDLNDLYWNQSRLSQHEDSFFLDEPLFDTEVFKSAKIPLGSAKWFASFDYRRFTLDAAIGFGVMKQEMESYYKDRVSIQSSVKQPAERILSQYKEKEALLRSLLWSLNVPLYILVAFYLYMVSNLLVERQRSEMAVLRSRGASRLQIVFLFALESAILSVLAFLVGPFVGAWFTSVLGASDSFMSFVQRKALLVDVNQESFIFAGGAAAFAFLVNLVPVILATRISIVDQKRQSARQEKGSIWHRFGLDFILLGLAFYGLFTFRRRTADMLTLGLEGKELAVDPLLFVVPSLFILGLGLLLLRLYPLLIKALYWAGKSRWSPSLYSSLLLVGRRSKQYHALMMFLILTIGTGVYSASAARTMNGNMEDQIWYRNGAEVVLSQNWIDDAPMMLGPDMGMSEAPPGEEDINYLEPPFDIFSKLPGVEHAARVFVKDDASFSAEAGSSKVRLMGINTQEFGETSWMKEDLLPYHFYEYLNLIAPDPRAVLVSTTLAKQFEVSPGDVLQVSWAGTDSMQVTVYGIIDYFPTFNPNPSGNFARDDEDVIKPMLIVGHLETIQNELALEPYDVWINMKASGDREVLYESFKENGIFIQSLDDSYEMIINSRNDPFRMAMNGVMSLGFILSLCITFSGFLLYWVLSLQGRTLQLGIFRAMGISFRNMLGMLSIEQLLTSGAGLAIGLISGAVTSYLFVPLFQISFDPGQIVPPFEVMIESKDTLNLTLFIVGMLGIALAILAWLLKRIKIHQAVKLGED